MLGFIADLPPPQGRHRCSKASHSCVRNTCRFVKFPGRVLYRCIGRAVRYLVDVLTPGWSFRDQDSALTELTNEVKLLDSPSSFRCCRCDETMQVPGVCVADAGQAYEAIRLERIWKAIDNLFNRAKRRFPSRCISVLKSRRAHVFPGETITTKFWDRTVFLRSSLRRALTGFMGFRFFPVRRLLSHAAAGYPDWRASKPDHLAYSALGMRVPGGCCVAKSTQTGDVQEVC